MTTPYNDHQAGLFAPIIDQRTGRTLYGAAAREYRLYMNNGVTGYQGQAIVEFQAHIAPVFEQMQNQLSDQQQQISNQQIMLQQMLQILQLRQGGQAGLPA